MRNIRTEDDIISNWKGDIEKPVVSICCITYNHESYIEDALEGFLIQETDFPFEILIHDDASTDHTADIIREYEAKYPNLIKPIYQTENQYSKGKKMMSTFLFPIAKGEFIAMCEGDDYWIAPEKLQAQVILMRQHPDINISFHPANKVSRHGLKKNDIYANYGHAPKVFKIESVVAGGGGFMPTSSLMIKQVVTKSQRLQRWLESSAVGDFIIQIHCSLNNGALFIPYKFSTYRWSSDGSWTVKMKDLAFRQKNLVKLTDSYKMLSIEMPMFKYSFKWLALRSNVKFLLLTIKALNILHFKFAMKLIFKSIIW